MKTSKPPKSISGGFLFVYVLNFNSLIGMIYNSRIKVNPYP